MGLRMRKSFKLGKSGVRLNVSKSGVGVSGGVKGLRVGTGPRGTRLTASIPGTGMSYEKSLSSKQRSSIPSEPAVTSSLTEAEAAKLADMTADEAAALLATVPPPRYKSGEVAFVLWLLTGLVGGHRYYLGRPKTAVLQTLTLGGVGLWWLTDLFLLRGMVRVENEARQLAWLRAEVNV